MSVLDGAAELGSLFVVSFLSGIFWVANAEGTAVYYSMERGWHPLVVATVCTAGQLSMFSLLFHGGGWLLPRWKWLHRYVERTRAKHGERLRKGYLSTTVFASAFGVPPLGAMSVLADGLAVSFARLLANAAGVRFVRFLLAAAAGEQLTAYWRGLWS